MKSIKKVFILLQLLSIQFAFMNSSIASQTETTSCNIQELKASTKNAFLYSNSYCITSRSERLLLDKSSLPSPSKVYDISVRFTTTYNKLNEQKKKANFVHAFLIEARNRLSLSRVETEFTHSSDIIINSVSYTGNSISGQTIKLPEIKVIKLLNNLSIENGEVSSEYTDFLDLVNYVITGNSTVDKLAD